MNLIFAVSIQVVFRLRDVSQSIRLVKLNDIARNQLLGCPGHRFWARFAPPDIKYALKLTSRIINFGTLDPRMFPRCPQGAPKGRTTNPYPMTGSAPDAQGVYVYICFFFKEGGREVWRETRSGSLGGSAHNRWREAHLLRREFMVIFASFLKKVEGRSGGKPGHCCVCSSP